MKVRMQVYVCSAANLPHQQASNDFLAQYGLTTNQLTEKS